MAENNHSSTALPVTEAPRVLVIGDIGQRTYHVGDEAMTIASAQALSEGGATVTLMTRDVGHSARYIGAAVNHEAVNHEAAQHEAGAPYAYLPFFLFPWAPAERELTLAALECVLTQLHADRERPSVTELVALPQVQALPEVLHPLAQTVERMVEFADAIATMDAVVVSGGGNLNSRYGWLLYERAAAVRAAEHAGVPVYVTGQSLGPV
ncbi:MAG: polysaccharide pyruvyl transferase family protein, partial [Rothia mucilaginosa]